MAVSEDSDEHVELNQVRNMVCDFGTRLGEVILSLGQKLKSYKQVIDEFKMT